MASQLQQARSRKLPYRVFQVLGTSIDDTKHMELPLSTKSIIADMLQTKEKFISIEYVNVQLVLTVACLPLLLPQQFGLEKSLNFFNLTRL